MKAAYLVSAGQAFERDIWDAARELGAQVVEPCAQYRDDVGRSLLISGALGATTSRTGRTTSSRPRGTPRFPT